MTRQPQTGAEHVFGHGRDAFVQFEIWLVAIDVRLGHPIRPAWVFETLYNHSRVKTSQETGWLLVTKSQVILGFRAVVLAH